MSKLCGNIHSDTAQLPATRGGSHNIVAWVQTEQGRITVDLFSDSAYRVYQTPVQGRESREHDAHLLAEGNVNTLPASLTALDETERHYEDL